MVCTSTALWAVLPWLVAAATSASATPPELVPRASSFAALPSDAFEREDECRTAAASSPHGSSCAFSALQLRGSPLAGDAAEAGADGAATSATAAELQAMAPAAVGDASAPSAIMHDASVAEAAAEAIEIVSGAAQAAAANVTAETSLDADSVAAAALTHEEAGAATAEAVTVVSQAAEVEVSMGDKTMPNSTEDEFELEWESGQEEASFGYEDDAEAVAGNAEPLVPKGQSNATQVKHPMEKDLAGEEAVEPEEGYYSAEDMSEEGYFSAVDDAEDDGWGSWGSLQSTRDNGGAQDEAVEAAGTTQSVITVLTQLTPVDKVPITGCHGENGTACPSGETCITKYDGTWSQCFSCSRATFGRECQKLDDFMRYAAVRTCKQTCLDQRCYNKNWCFSPYRCIVDHEEQWGQCISCNSKKFWQNSCNAMKEGLKHIASKTCHRRCGR